ncbi:hypothetical protein J7K93_02460 [bacterium]|nr:hypothetical protein [bacterium]
MKTNSTDFESRLYDMSDSTILITGSSSGIGRIRAVIVIRAGADIVHIARDIGNNATR